MLKKDPGSLSVGYGSATHRIASLIPMRMEGVNIKAVRMPIFEGGRTTIMLLGGHTDVLLTSVVQCEPHVKSGKVRVLAVSSPKRLGGVFASAPTWEELGYRSGSGSWRSIIAPKGLTVEQVAYWEGVMKRVVESDAFGKEAEKNQWETTFRGAAETRAFMEMEYKELKNLAGFLGLAKQ